LTTIERSVTNQAAFIGASQNMAKASTALVLAIDNTVAGQRKLSGWQGHDRVFMHRSQISRGTRIVDFGRRHHGEEYEVIDIKTHVERPSGIVTKSVGSINKLTDDIVMRRVGKNSIRTLSFSMLSYSAVWRLK